MFLLKWEVCTVDVFKVTFIRIKFVSPVKCTRKGINLVGDDTSSGGTVMGVQVRSKNPVLYFPGHRIAR